MSKINLEVGAFYSFPASQKLQGRGGNRSSGNGKWDIQSSLPPPPPLSLESSFNTPQWEDLFVFLSPPLLLLPDLGESLDLPLPYIIDKDFYRLLFYTLRLNHSVFFFFLYFLAGIWIVPGWRYKGLISSS